MSSSLAASSKRACHSVLSAALHSAKLSSGWDPPRGLGDEAGVGGILDGVLDGIASSFVSLTPRNDEFLEF